MAALYNLLQQISELRHDLDSCYHHGTISSCPGSHLIVDDFPHTRYSLRFLSKGRSRLFATRMLEVMCTDQVHRPAGIAIAFGYVRYCEPVCAALVLILWQ